MSKTLPAVTIQGKIDKKYGKYNGALWLLAYELDRLRLGEPESMSNVRKVLNSSEHPFKEVWYLFPSSAGTGHAVRLWPDSGGGGRGAG